MKLHFKDGNYILEPHTNYGEQELSELVGFHVSISKEDLQGVSGGITAHDMVVSQTEEVSRLLRTENPIDRDRLYMAQQTLKWAQSPNDYKSPVNFIKDIQAGGKGCSLQSYQEEL